MAIAIRGTTPVTSAVSGPNPITNTLTGTQQPQSGDVLIIIHGNDYYDITNLVTPTVGGSTSGVTAITGATVDAGSLTSHAKCWYYIVGSTGDLTVSETETGAGDEEKLLVTYVLSGADTSTVIDVAGGTFSATTTTSPVAPAVSPTSSNAFLICHTHPIGSPAGPYSPPSGMTESYDTTDGVPNISLAGATQQLSASGTTGTKTFTSTGSRGYIGISIAVLTGGPAAPPPEPGPMVFRPPARMSPNAMPSPWAFSDAPPSPADVPGLAGWWKADALGLANGTAVSSWTDSSGNAQNLVQASGTLQPVFTTNVLNGLPVLRFDGTDDAMTATIVSWPQPTNWFVVMKAADNTGYLQIIHTGQEILRRDTDLRIESYAGSSASNVSMTHDTSWDYYDVEFTGASTMGYRIGGVSYPPWGDAGSGATGTTFDLGFHPSNGRNFHGDIAEVILFARALNSTERETVFGYLRDKYFPSGSAVNAPAGTATATGTGQDAAVSIAANAGQPTAAGTGQDAQGAVGANAESPTATGTALDATVAITVNAEAPTAIGSAPDAVAALAVFAEQPTAAGAASDALAAVGASPDTPSAVGTSLDPNTAITFTAEQPTATGASFDALAGVGANAEQPTAAGTSFDTSVASTANAEQPSAVGTAGDAVAALGANAESPSSAGTAFDATVSTAAATNAPAEAAAGTGAAQDAQVAVAANAEQPTATGTAGDGSASVAVTASTPAAAGTGQDATAAIAVNAEAPAATGAAFDATVSTSSSVNAPAEQPTAAGTAFDATVALGANAEQPTAVGSALDATGSVAPNAGAGTATGSAGDGQVAITATAEAPSATGSAGDAIGAVGANAGQPTAAGTAFDATVSTQTVTNAPAEQPTATGQAFDASVAITFTAGQPTATGTASDALGGVGATPNTPAAAGTAFDATVAIGVPAGFPTAVGTAYGPTASFDATLIVVGNPTVTGDQSAAAVTGDSVLAMVTGDQIAATIT